MLVLLKKTAAKRAAYVILIALISLVLTFQYRDLFPSGNYVEITAIGEKNEKSLGTEVWLLSFAPDGNKIDLSQNTSDDWQLRNNALISNWGTVTFELGSYDYIYINMIAHPWSGIVEIKTPAGTERYDLYRSADDETQRFEIYLPYSPVRINPWGLDYFLFFMAIFILAIFRLKFGLCGFVRFAYGLLLGVILMTSSYINWDTYSRAAFVIISGFIMFSTLTVFVSGEWKRYSQTISKRIILLLIILYAVFSSTYNQVVTESIPVHIKPFLSVFVLSWLIFWTAACFAFFKGFERLQNGCVRNIESEKTKKTKSWVLWLRVFGIVMLGYSFWIAAYYPANMSQDSITLWAQTIGLSPLNDMIPVVHTILVRLTLIFIESPFMPVITQTVIQCAIWATAAVYLSKQRLSEKLIYIMAVVVGLNPVNGVYTVTLWKDIAYSIAILALVLTLVRCVSSERKPSIIQNISFAAALFFTATLRHNGIVILVVLALILTVFYFKAARTALLAAVLAVVFILKGVVYPLFDITVSSNGSILVYAIGSVYYNDGKISDEDRKVLEKDTPVELWKAGYNPFVINPYAFSGDEMSVTERMKDVKTSELIKIYLNLLVNNPSIILRHHLSNSDITWGLNQSCDPIAYTYLFETGIMKNWMGLEKEPNQLTAITNFILEYVYLCKLPFIFVRNGIYNILILFLCYYALLKKKFKANLISVPVLGNTLSLLVFNVAQDYRYAYAAMFTFPLIFMLYLVLTKAEENELQ